MLLFPVNMFDGQVKTKQGKIGREKDSPSQTNIIDERANHHQEEVQVGRQKDQDGKGEKSTKGSVMGLPFKRRF